MAATQPGLPQVNNRPSADSPVGVTSQGAENSATVTSPSENVTWCLPAVDLSPWICVNRSCIVVVTAPASSVAKATFSVNHFERVPSDLVKYFGLSEVVSGKAAAIKSIASARVEKGSAI